MKKKCRYRIKLFTILLLVLAFVTSCGTQSIQENDDVENGQNNQDKNNIITLTLATFQEDVSLKKQVDIFNQNNSEYQIEIQRYERSLSPEEDGIAKLQREIMSGGGPDLIDYGSDYCNSDIVGGYTENLLSYLSEEFNQDIYFENIVNSFIYKDSLYALPVSFTLDTFVGDKEMLGGRESWNVEEMLECYTGKKDKMILYPGEFKKDVFANILTGSMEYYIDWETGTCNFNGTQFKQVMEFANLFPNSLIIEEEFSVKQFFYEGKALLLPLRLSNIYDISSAEHIFDSNNISYIGFPVEGRSGTVIKESGPMLAISIGSKHKEIAWEFIRQFLSDEYQYGLESGFPIKRSVFEDKLVQNQTPTYEMKENGSQTMVSKYQIRFEGEEPIELYYVTEEQCETLMQLIESATICAVNDYQLYCALLEEADSYFSGSKELNDVLEVMQSRAYLYINEKID